LRQARAAPRWRRTASDSLLTIAGVALVTGIIAAVQLYPRLPSIMLSYLLVIITLARLRGSYAAVLAAVLASFSFDFFFTPPLYKFSIADLTADDLLDPWVFLTTGIIAGQLIVALQRRAEQARRREQETRLLSEQAQQLAAFQERQRLARELHDSVSQDLYGIRLGAYTAREALDSDPGEAIAQEALHNIVKHACASTVTLRLSSQEDKLILEVCDDGKGFDPTGPFPGHLGLLSMQERAVQMGGTCSIESAPEWGTYFRVCIPILPHEKPGDAGVVGERH